MIMVYPHRSDLVKDNGKITNITILKTYHKIHPALDKLWIPTPIQEFKSNFRNTILKTKIIKEVQTNWIIC